eukprot:gene5816-11117_t
MSLEAKITTQQLDKVEFPASKNTSASERKLGDAGATTTNSAGLSGLRIIHVSFLEALLESVVCQKCKFGKLSITEVSSKKMGLASFFVFESDSCAMGWFAPAMEPEGVKRIFLQSAESRHLQYTGYIGSVVVSNEGLTAMGNVLLHLRIEPGSNTMTFFSRIYRKRKRESAANAMITSKKLDNQKGKQRKGRKTTAEKEGVTYEAGGF